MFGPLGLAGGAQAWDEPTRAIAANINDPGITTARGANLIYLNADPARRVGKLLVFLPSGGATNLPTEFKELGTESARLGYHTILLAYRNEAPIAAPPPAGCGNTVEASPTFPTCTIDGRMELIDGRNESTVLDVDRANSIENRLNKVLAYLVATYPSEGWAPFLDSATGEPVWPQMVIAGASLGAGQAAIMASQHPMYRAALLHGWTDAKHGWVKLGMTASSRYGTLIHARETIFERTCYAYVALGLAPSCPLPGFTVPPATVDPTNPLLVENRRPPFGTNQLVHNLEPFSFETVADPFHTSTTRDGWIAREADGTPSQKLLNAWRSVLGDSDADTRLDQVDNCPLVANVSQADSDGNGVGDACPSGVVGGTVGATLSLVLGVPAAFGAFTPGVDRDYDASTTATVISSAGDAGLSVSDPLAASAGRLVNGAFALSEPLQARASSAGGVGAPLAALGTTPLPLLTYSGPLSNDAVTLAFRQHIGAAQALRTGTYSKTLTFTLSTTTP